MASAFVASPRARFGTSVSMSSPAKSAEEDLELTRKVILDFISADDEEEPAPKKEAPKEE